MSSPRTRIVFIGGYARTGSTLLDRLLGQLDGFESFGELRHIWDRSFLGNQLCGCRRPFRECPFWNEVVDRAFGGWDGIDAAAVSRHKRSVDGFWNIPRIVSGKGSAAYRRRMAAYVEPLGALYSAIQDVSGATYLVDSTKDPQHAYLLRSIPGFDVRMVHLVRDSRSVAYSWRRVRRRPEVTWEDRDMPRFPPFRSAMAWDLANAATEAARRFGLPYVRVRYEDLVGDPRSELRRILDVLDLGAPDLSFLGRGTADLSRAHTVAGNPMRFQEGTIQIRSDEEWADRMPRLDRAIVTAMTFPLLVRYSYTRDMASASAGPRAGEMWRTLRLAFAHRSEPLRYGRAVSGLVLRYLRSHDVPISGRRWLDVGAGSGTLPEALQEAGADVVALDLSDRRAPVAARTPFVIGRGEVLPFADCAFDGVTSSNVLEHVRDPWGVIDELLRVCRPGGFVYLSWTNWFSPFGGHDWSPFHYLGVRAGPRVFRAIHGRPPMHVPGRTLFPVHVGSVLRMLRRSRVQLVDVAPRYWPTLRAIARVPGLREVAMWNCVVLMRKAPVAPEARPR
jgi:SAM-dependent methyltransferase